VVFIVLVGFICLVIPGIFFYVAYIFVAQVVVLELLSGGTALQRSWNLTYGFRWRIFGVLLLIIIGARLVEYGVELGLAKALPTIEYVPTEYGRHYQINKTNYMVDTFISQLVQILFTTYASVCTTLLYLDVRIRKEGFDLEMAAKVEEPEPTGWDKDPTGWDKPLDKSQ
jgi:hypothetical protein